MKRVCVYYIIFFYQLATTVRVRVCRLSNYLLCVEDTFSSFKVGLIDDVSCVFDINESKMKSNELNRNSPPAAHSRKKPCSKNIFVVWKILIVVQIFWSFFFSIVIPIQNGPHKTFKRCDKKKAILHVSIIMMNMKYCLRFSDL